MTSVAAEVLEGELEAALAKTRYFSILSDGSTDSGVVEQDLVYVLYVGDGDKSGQSYLKLKSVGNGTTEVLTQLLLNTVDGVGLGDSSKPMMVGFGADSVSISMGRQQCTASTTVWGWMCEIRPLIHATQSCVLCSCSCTTCIATTRRDCGNWQHWPVPAGLAFFTRSHSNYITKVSECCKDRFCRVSFSTVHRSSTLTCGQSTVTSCVSTGMTA